MAGEDFHWTFGDKAHIRFPSGGDPVVDAPHSFLSGEGSATISDSGGNLLFHTDGTNLYGPPPVNAVINPVGQPLGGNSSSCHSAIIVPPAPGGSLYHVFAVGDWDPPQAHIGPVRYTPVSLSPTLALAAPTTSLTFGPLRAAEKLAAVSHQNCRGYWVVSLHIDATTPATGELFAMLVDSDAGPTSGNTVHQAYPYPPPEHGYCTKFSPDGSLLAMSSLTRIDILNFDRATGAFTKHSQVVGGDPLDALYGVEFSPNGKYLYFTAHKSGRVWRHIIPASGSGSVALGTVAPIQPWTLPPSWGGAATVGALQLGPNGKIYGAKYGDYTLFEIGDPDNASLGSIDIKTNATQADGQDLLLSAGAGYLGLPTFTRPAGDCDDRCRAIAEQVEEQIARRRLVNSMPPCRGEPEEPRCEPLEMPAVVPQTFIRWGDSACDCIESDDTEVMQLTVCNPYSNVTLSNLVVHELAVVDANGSPVPLLPDGTPSIELVPAGPHCFDDIAPCACVTREFMVRLRGALSGPYRILVRGICFDACFHGDEEACFSFEVCKD